MKKVGIATDSHSGILPDIAEQLGVEVLPMPFYVEEECCYEGVTITREQFFAYLQEGKKVSTSQPSPESVIEFWRKQLKECEQLLYLPMSSGLSGSCNTAMVLAQEEEFDGKVFVVDHGRIGTPLHRTILDALEMAEEGIEAARIKQILEDTRENMSIYIAVETLEHLKRGGRVSPAAAALGTLLNIKPILKLGTDVLDVYKKSRGMKKAKKEMIEALRNDFKTVFRESYENGEVYLLAASSADAATTKEWVEEIEAEFPGMEVLCDDLTLGVCCHTGAGALGIGCSCRPKR